MYSARAEMGVSNSETLGSCDEGFCVHAPMKGNLTVVLASVMAGFAADSST